LNGYSMRRPIFKFAFNVAYIHETGFDNSELANIINNFFE